MNQRLFSANDILATVPGFVYWKDLESNYLGCSKNLAMVCGLTHTHDIIGRSDYELPWWKYTDSYRSDDQDVFSDEDSVVLHNIVLASKTEHIIITRKTPVKDKDGHIIALAGGVTFLQDPHILASIDLLRRADAQYFGGKVIREYEIKKYFQGMTRREATCLFHLIRGKSQRAIGKQLRISPRTVETHIESLKNKFGCMTKEVLIEKAFASGFAGVIPEGILSNPLTTL